MKHVVRIWVLAFLLWIATLHCSTTANGFVVVVNSDIPNSDIEEVKIVVSREGQSPQTKLAKNPAFPLTLGVTSDPGDRVGVRVTGLRGGNVVVENFANATVQDDEQRMLVLDLCRQCEGLACNGDFVCVTETTCSAPGVDGPALPKWADSPPKTACQERDRPKRESSQTTAPPPVIAPTGDAGSDSGPGPATDGGSSEAGFSCGVCPSGTQCNEAASSCTILAFPTCEKPLDITLGGTFTASSCSNQDYFQGSCVGKNWTVSGFAVNALPEGKTLHVRVTVSPVVDLSWATYAGVSCEASFASNCMVGSPLEFDVTSHTQFVIGQKGQVCNPYVLEAILK
jgi:hypothetical protein